jgi:hypothetical protein
LVQLLHYFENLMSNYATPSTTYNRSILVVPQIMVALAGGLLIFALLMGALILGYSSHYADQIYPGVWVAGIDLSGLDPAEAAARLAKHFDYPEREMGNNSGWFLPPNWDSNWTRCQPR